MLPFRTLFLILHIRTWPSRPPSIFLMALSLRRYYGITSFGGTGKEVAGRPVFLWVLLLIRSNWLVGSLDARWLLLDLQWNYDPGSSWFTGGTSTRYKSRTLRQKTQLPQPKLSLSIGSCKGRIISNQKLLFLSFLTRFRPVRTISRLHKLFSPSHSCSSYIFRLGIS